LSTGGGGARRPPGFPLPLSKVGGASVARTAVHRPQRPLADVHAERARERATAAVSGLGLDSQAIRERMVQKLAAGGVDDAAVLAAFATVPRHRFLDAALVGQAYEDTSLPIGHGQTISKPSVVARMLALARQGANARAQGNLGAVLEIGTGCGYQAALLAELSRKVVSIERLQPLHEKARALLGSARSPRIRLVWGDGMRGHPPEAPYDTIVAAAGGAALPPAWLEQLAVGGRLVAPVEGAGGGQVLAVVDRDEAGWHHGRHEAVRFVPLRSGLSRT
jgi:protein-L-isoaspartate(D-aspartate) O-methyltransferase